MDVPHHWLSIFPGEGLLLGEPGALSDPPRRVIVLRYLCQSRPARHRGAIARELLIDLRRGYGLAWEVPTPTAKELEPLGDPYRLPHGGSLALLAGR